MSQVKLTLIVTLSITADHDKLTTMLSNLGHNFHVIGLTETRIMTSNDPLVNIDIPGSKFISQLSVRHAGGSVKRF